MKFSFKKISSNKSNQAPQAPQSLSLKDARREDKPRKNFEEDEEKKAKNKFAFLKYFSIRKVDLIAMMESKRVAKNILFSLSDAVPQRKENFETSVVNSLKVAVSNLNDELISNILKNTNPEINENLKLTGTQSVVIQELKKSDVEFDYENERVNFNLYLYQDATKYKLPSNGKFSYSLNELCPSTSGPLNEFKVLKNLLLIDPKNKELTKNLSCLVYDFKQIRITSVEKGALQREDKKLKILAKWEIIDNLHFDANDFGTDNILKMIVAADGYSPDAKLVELYETTDNDNWSDDLARKLYNSNSSEEIKNTIQELYLKAYGHSIEESVVKSNSEGPVPEESNVSEEPSNVSEEQPIPSSEDEDNTYNVTEKEIEEVKNETTEPEQAAEEQPTEETTEEPRKVETLDQIVCPNCGTINYDKNQTHCYFCLQPLHEINISDSFFNTTQKLCIKCLNPIDECTCEPLQEIEPLQEPLEEAECQEPECLDINECLNECEEINYNKMNSENKYRKGNKYLFIEGDKTKEEPVKNVTINISLSDAGLDLSKLVFPKIDEKEIINFITSDNFKTTIVKNYKSSKRENEAKKLIGKNIANKSAEKYIISNGRGSSLNVSEWLHTISGNITYEKQFKKYFDTYILDLLKSYLGINDGLAKRLVYTGVLPEASMIIPVKVLDLFINETPNYNSDKDIAGIISVSCKVEFKYIDASGNLKTIAVPFGGSRAENSSLIYLNRATLKEYNDSGRDSNKYMVNPANNKIYTLNLIATAKEAAKVIGKDAIKYLKNKLTTVKLGKIKFDENHNPINLK